MDDKKLAQAFKALSNPNRLRLFQEIRSADARSYEQGCSLRSVVDLLSVGAPTVSHHLKELVNAGLVVTERQGKFVQCHVDRDVLAELRVFLIPGAP